MEHPPTRPVCRANVMTVAHERGHRSTARWSPTHPFQEPRLALHGASSDPELSGTRVGSGPLPWRTGGVRVTPSAFRIAGPVRFLFPAGTVVNAAVWNGTSWHAVDAGRRMLAACMASPYMRGTRQAL